MVNRPYLDVNSCLERFHRLRLFDFFAAVLAGAPGVIVPKVEHRLAEVLNDIGAIKMDVFHQRLAMLAVKDDMLGHALGPAFLHHHAQRIGWTHGRVGHIWWNEKGFTLTHEMINDVIAFADPDLDVPLELVKKFLRINLVEVVSRVRSLDDHDEEVAPVIKIAVADRRLEEMTVLFDPLVQVEGRLHRGGGGGRGR